MHTVHGFCARLLRDEALEAGHRPVRRHRRARRPPRAAARARRRADAAPPRLPRQPGGDAGRRRRADRPPQGGAASPRASTSGGRPRCRPATSAPSASASSPRSTGPTTGCCASRARSTSGDLVLLAHALLAERPHVRARVAARWSATCSSTTSQDLELAGLRLVLAAGRRDRRAPHGGGRRRRDDRRACAAPRALGLRTLTEDGPGPARRAPGAGPAAAPRADPRRRGRGRRPDRGPPRQGRSTRAAGRATVRFWRCANERAQAQAVAAEVERLVRDGRRARRIGVLVRSVRREGQALAVALEERAVPYRLVGARARSSSAPRSATCSPGCGCSSTPRDAGRRRPRAVARRRSSCAPSTSRAASRSRGGASSTWSPRSSPRPSRPSSRPRRASACSASCKLHRPWPRALDTTRPDLFVHRLIDRLGLRRQQALRRAGRRRRAPRSLARLGRARRVVRRAASPQATRARVRPPRRRGRRGRRCRTTRTTPRTAVDAGAVAVLPMHAARGTEFRPRPRLRPAVRAHAGRAPARLVEPIPDALLHEPPAAGHARGARRRDAAPAARGDDARRRGARARLRRPRGHAAPLQPPSPFAEEARAALGAEWDDREEELFGPDEALHAAFGALRDDLLRSLPRVGARLGELRLDTDLDVAHGVVRYLELRQARGAHEPLRGPGARRRAAGGQRRDPARGDRPAARDPPDLAARRRPAARRARRPRPRRGARRPRRAVARALPARAAATGLLLSASDIETYRTCPLKYKFARVFRIPSEPTLNQRFGILVHQVLERYHSSGGRTLDELLGLLEAGWRRGGFGASEEERQLHGKADASLRRYFERDRADDAEPVWFERGFQFRLGDAHAARARRPRRPPARRRLRAHRLQDGPPQDARPSCARTSSSRSTRSAPARRGSSTRRGSPTSTSSTTRRCRCRPRTSTRPGSPRRWPRSPTASSARASSPRRPYSACSWCDFRIACPAAER